MARLREVYKSEIASKLQKELGLANVMEVPRITKVTLNMGVGEAIGDKKALENAVADLTLISGQKPVINNARKSIAGFKVRQGWPIGTKVTLRRERMYEFLERLIGVGYPLGSVTSGVLVPSSLMVEVISQWVSVSKLSFPKSIMKKLISCEAWILLSPPQLAMMTKVAHCCGPLTSR
jgi:hypothetical protein